MRLLRQKQTKINKWLNWDSLTTRLRYSLVSAVTCFSEHAMPVFSSTCCCSFENRENYYGLNALKSGGCRFNFSMFFFLFIFGRLAWICRTLCFEMDCFAPHTVSRPIAKTLHTTTQTEKATKQVLPPT